MNSKNGTLESSVKRIEDVSLNVQGHVVTAIIDRPQVRNAINDGVIAGLDAAVEITAERQARVLVIRGADGTFCSGADLRQLEVLRQNSVKMDEFMARLGALFDRLEAAPFAVVAVVEGHAVAGGCELLLACDVAIASTAARIGDRHLEYGLVPAAGGSVRLSRYLPRARANYLLLSADLLTGQQAAAWGLVTMAVEPARLNPFADQVISRIASRSRHGLATIKKMIRNARGLPVHEAAERERALFQMHMATADAGTGLVAFRERRAPVFTIAVPGRE